jgi:dienelactone hydrolase
MSRIAMMGWSYGGFMSLMAIDRARHGPDLAPSPARRRPSWGLYDTALHRAVHVDAGSQRREGYAASDAIPRLPNMTGRLLLMHGMADDNVILENSTRVIDAMQAQSRPFELMLYPRPAPRGAGQRKAAAAVADVSRLPRPDDRDKGARHGALSAGALLVAATAGTQCFRATGSGVGLQDAVGPTGGHRPKHWGPAVAGMSGYLRWRRPRW